MEELKAQLEELEAFVAMKFPGFEAYKKLVRAGELNVRESRLVEDTEE